MIDYHEEVNTALNTILPTHYEMVLDSDEGVPCLSYMELTNIATETGDTLGYSRIQYQVKVWANDITEIQYYALLVDETMRPLGFKRVSSGELYDNNSTMIQKIMTYEALALESY